METVFTKKDIVVDLAERTGYYKKDLKFVLDELSDLISEYIGSATIDSPVKITLISGIALGGKCVPEKEGTNPSTQEKMLIPEHVVPYAKFSGAFRNKLKN